MFIREFPRNFGQRSFIKPPYDTHCVNRETVIYEIVGKSEWINMIVDVSFILSCHQRILIDHCRKVHHNDY